jgi:hypothetical protein
MLKSPLRKAELALLRVSTRDEVTAGAVGFGAAGAVGVGAAGCSVGFGAAGTVGVGATGAVVGAAGGRVAVGVGALGASGWQPTRTSSSTPAQQARSRTV